MDDVRRRGAVGGLVLWGMALLLLLGPGRAEAAREGAGAETVAVQLSDLELIDQDGARVKFKSDVIGNRVAVVIPFYTTCTTAYPILVFMFTRLQTLLGEHLGKDVVLVSVSVDPRTDIPIRLKAFAKRQKALPGWTFLSGERENLAQALLGIGVLFTANLDEHNHIPITIVGTAEGEWRRFHGFPSPDLVLSQVNRLLDARQVASGGAAQ